MPPYLAGPALGHQDGASVAQLKGIRCPPAAWENGQIVLSCADAISRVLSQHAGIKVPEAKNVAGRVMGSCMECGGPLIHEGGCMTCRGCGFSRCD